MLDREKIISILDLKPLPPEGGYFVETYRSAEKLTEGALLEESGAPRSLSTAIYYLLTPDTFSAIHRLRSVEVYHFYLGSPVEMINLHPGGGVEMMTLGTDMETGMRPQAVVPAGVWQGSRLVKGGELALLGTTLAPGFDRADYEQGSREDLIRAFPAARDLITALTRE